MQELLLDSLVQAIAETVMAEISFPHFDAGRLAGYELKKGDFTRFATEGTKELWVSNIRIDDDCINCIVFGESAIDALSHAALFRNENTRTRATRRSGQAEAPLPTSFTFHLQSALPTARGGVFPQSTDLQRDGLLTCLRIGECHGCHSLRKALSDQRACLSLGAWSGNGPSAG